MWAGVFPGQGSQVTGMGRFLADEFSVARLVFEEVNDALKFDLKRLCFDGPEADLALTQNTQPALLTVSVACYRVLRELTGFTPTLMAGHSIGEYAAVVNSEMMSLRDAAVAVRRRGEWMQEAVPLGEGGMLAILGWQDDQVRALCRWASESSKLGLVEPANFNAPGQIVVSGHKKALDWMQENYKADVVPGAPARLKAIALKVSAPFHCALMKPAEDRMRKLLEEMKFQDSKSQKVVQNVTAEASSDSKVVRENLIQQISAPVRWVDCVLRLKALGVTHFIEMGSGKVLAGLVKKIDSENLQTFNMTTLDELKQIEALKPH